MDILKLSKYKNIDLRSEHEFRKSTIPGSINLPILRDPEFESIGKEYKAKGQKAALELGLQIVSGDVKKRKNKMEMQGATCIYKIFGWHKERYFLLQMQ